MPGLLNSAANVDFDTKSATRPGNWLNLRLYVGPTTSTTATSSGAGSMSRVADAN